ncbi:bifunctional diguanylate cyclase/phosphodiesterase [Thiohalophilus thiocyanatoxydans]|uniref:bifunctional diguanylate cyclase/phosphodiesterase n=1 Tax=Thiohalophilus thiocyanatoxydans TaxID=381308 RepID=UPI001416F498|nr:EAL domain-containing protein [Thiohalophilus thiocyanatoxydans]
MSPYQETDNPAESDNSRRPILWLFILLTVMALIGFSISAWQLWVDAKRDARDKLGYVNRQLVQGTRATFIKHETVLRIVGEELVRSGALENPEQGRDIIEDMQRTDPGMVGFGLAAPNGQLLIVSGVPEGKSLPNLMEQEVSVDSFHQALNSDGLVAGRPYFMPLLDDWVIPIRTTIKDANSEPVAVMTAGYQITGGTTAWGGLELPEEVGVGMIRSDGYLQYAHFIQNEAISRQHLDEIYSSPSVSYIIEALEKNKAQEGFIALEKGFSADDLLLAYEYLPDYNLYAITALPQARIVKEFLHKLAPWIALMSIYLALGFIGYRSALTTQRKNENQLAYLAHHDSLTDLPNRTLMRDRLEQALKIAHREHEHVALLFIDLDRFKEINDQHGHAHGDALLQVIAPRLQQAVRPSDTVARLGGDEFLIILPDIHNGSSLEKLLMRIREQLVQPITLNQIEHRISASIGVAIYPDDAENADELLRYGDIALFEAKDRGRDCHAYYDSQLNERAQRRSALREALERALSERALYVHYQPQLSAKASEVECVEALVRWESDKFGAVSPEEFIPLAEESGLINELGEFVLNQALADVQELNRRCETDIRLSVNISAQQMLDSKIVSKIREALDAANFSPEALTLELTETVLIQEFDRIASELRTLRDMGIDIAIDDFGTGYSSLSYLNRLPISELKIDRSFVRDIDQNKYNRKLIASIIALGKGHEVRLVAEGVETSSQAILLRELGCHLLQGFHFARPMSIDKLIDFVGYGDHSDV